MFKRLVSMLLALSMVLSVCPVYAAAETMEELGVAEEEIFFEEVDAFAEMEPVTEFEEPVIEEEFEEVFVEEEIAPEEESEEIFEETLPPESKPVAVPEETVPVTVPGETAPEEFVEEPETQETVPAAAPEVEASKEAAMATTYESFSVGETKTVSLENDDYVSYSVTVAEDGLYTFYNPTKEYIYWEVGKKIVGSEESWYDSEDSDYNGLGVKLKAGQEYRVCAWNYSGSDRTVELKFIEAIEPTRIDFYSGQSYMVGTNGGVGFEKTPWYANKAPQMVSSDESVVVVTDVELSGSYESGTVYFDVVGEGTATITATLSNGKTDGVIVTGKAAIPLRENVPMDTELPDSENRWFTFTPAESGYYTVRVTHSNTNMEYVDLYVDNSYGGETHGNSMVTNYMEAGETYTIRTWSSYRSFASLMVTKSVPAESFSLRTTEKKVQTGNTFRLYWDFEPFNAMPESVRWTSSDENIVTFSWQNNNYADFDVGNTPGTAVLTATTEGGMTATCTVTVEAIPEIHVNETVRGDLTKDDSYTYLFTAPATASYVLSPADGNDSYWNVYNESGEYVESGWVENQTSLVFSCVEGEQYTLKVVDQQQWVPGYAATLTEAMAPDSVIFRGSNTIGFVGQEMSVHFEYTPSNADLSQIQWTVSDESLAEITYIGDSYVDLMLKMPGVVTLTAAMPNGNMASVDITVKAPMGEMTVGNPQELFVMARDRVAYRFTAPDDGEYVFWNSNDPIDGGYYGYIRVVSPEGWNMASGNRRTTADLEAGETYLVVLENESSRNISAVLNVAASVSAQSIAFQQEEYTGYVGQNIHMELDWFPINASYEDLIWTSSDTSVVEVEWNNDYQCNVRLMDAGTATITASNGMGLSASCTVTAKSRTPISVGFRDSVTLERQESVAYIFVAPEDGRYIFRNASSGYLEVEVYDVSSDEHTYGNKAVMNAEKGEVFHITCTNHQDAARTFELCLEETVEPTSIQLSRTAYTACVGDTFHVQTNLFPANAYSDITWDISDPSVADITWSNNEGVDFTAFEIGTAVITATTENGLSDSFVLTVEEPEVITSPGSAYVTLSGQSQKAFQFTPEESGYYIFWKENSNYNCGVSAQVMGSGGTESMENRVMFYAEAGRTYLLKVYCYTSEDRSASYNMRLDTCAPLESVQMLFDMNEDHVTGMVGNTSYVRLQYFPGNASYERVEWIVEDTDIAEVGYCNDTNANIYLKKVGTTTLTVMVDDYVITAPIVVKDATQIEAPYSKTHTLDPGESVMFRFTAPADGEYVIWDASTERNYPHILVRGDGYGVGNNTRVQFTAKKGVTYDISVDNIQSYTAKVKLKLEKAVKATGLEFDVSKVQGWAGQYCYLEPVATPVNGDISDMTVKVDDTSVAEVTFVSPTNIELYLKKAGTVKVTMTCGKLKDTCTITVKKPSTISLGTTKKITVEEGFDTLVRFTAPETGTYVVWDKDYSNCGMQIMDGNGMYLDWDRSRMQFDAVAGEEISIIMWNMMPGKQTYNVRVDKAAPLTDFTIGEGTLYAIADSYWFIIPEATPGNADMSDIFWSVSNPDVAFVEDPYAYTAGLVCVQEGTAELTATSGGITRTIKVVVENGELKAPVLKASNDTQTGKPVLSWNAVPGAVEYKVYRGSSKTGEYKLKGTVQDTSFLDSSASAEKTYYYYVVAVSAGGNKSDKSNVKSRQCDLAQPVISLSNATSTGKIKISWDAVDGAEKYQVYRADSEDGTYESLKTTTSKSYTDSSATAGKTYYYKVKAIADDTDANSAYSEISSKLCKLARPDVTAEVVASSGLVELTWEAVDKATGYEIYRSATKDGEGELQTTVTGTEWTHEDAEPGITCYYRVKAVMEENENANSELSSVDSGARTLAQPTKPTMSNDAATGKNVATWNAVEGAVAYSIYRASSKTGTYTEKATVTETTYTDTSATAGKTYYYKVMAVAADSNANSAFSSVNYRLCDLAQPVIELSNVSSSGKIKISWDAVDGAEKYQVYRADSEDGTYESLKTTTSKSYTDSSATAGKTYFYKVKAIAKDSGANSVYSEIKDETCNLARPDVSAEVVASSGLVKLEWEKIKKATAYEIYRTADVNADYEKVGVTEETEWTDDTAVAGTMYYYRVKAVLEGKEADSALSSVDTGVRKLTQPELTMTGDEVTGKNVATWNAVEGAAAYRIYRATSKTGKYSKLAEVTELTYTDTSATAGKTYYYKVMAVAEISDDANSAYSSVQSRMCDLAQPEITLSSVASSGKIKISWKAVSKAVEYKVYRATEENGKYKSLKTTTSTSYTDKSASEGKTYYYKVKAIAKDSGANSAYSEIKSEICKLERTTVTLSNVSSTGKIKVSWTEVDKAVRYDIYRSEDKSTGFEKVGQSEGTSWTDNTEIEAGKTYYYKVLAIASEEGADAAFSSVKSLTCKLARPDVSIAKSSKGKPQLTWEAVEGAVSYKVYRATSKSGTYKPVATVTEPGYTDTKASSGKTYYYKVMAISANSDANSAYSSVDSIKSK